MSTVDRKIATIDDLYKVEGKAELVGGEILKMSPSGFEHGCVAGVIYRSLWNYSKTIKSGVALADNVGFLCQLERRQSFSPDVSFYNGELPRPRKNFLPKPPIFAVEIRSANDYGPRGEKAMTAKRADYFAAGTKAVWDVDPDGPVFVRLYLSESPDQPIEFQAGDIAHAEPVLPGWALPVDDILDEIR